MKIFLFALASLAAMHGEWTLLRNGDWVPDAETAASLRDGLKAEFDRNVAAQHRSKPYSLNDYSFQYQGTTLVRKRVIVVIAFCRSPPDQFDLTREAYVVSDGGACYFHALYDPENHTYVKFWFNGIA